jgi:ankyrin repeat protein
MKKIIFLLTLINIFSVHAAELDSKLQEEICKITAKGLVGDLALFLSTEPKYIKSKNSQGAGLMHIATSAGNPKLTKFLKDQGLTFSGIDKLGNSVLHYANTKTIAQCLTAKIDINCTNFHGQTPLHLACQEKDSERRTMVHIAEELINKKANIDSLDNHLETPLSLAIEHNAPEIISLLLAKNADPSLANSRGVTPIDFLRKSPAFEETTEGLFQSNSAELKPWRIAKAEAQKALKEREAQENIAASAQVNLMLKEMREEAEAKAATLTKERRHSI